MAEIARTCHANIHWQTIIPDEDGEKYTVQYGHLSGAELNRQRVQYGWTCACRYFKQRGACVHITVAVNSNARCSWNDNLDPAVHPKADLTCPKCGGPTDTIPVEV